MLAHRQVAAGQIPGRAHSLDHWHHRALQWPGMPAPQTALGPASPFGQSAARAVSGPSAQGPERPAAKAGWPSRQVRFIRKLISESLGAAVGSKLEVNSVDGAAPPTDTTLSTLNLSTITPPLRKPYLCTCSAPPSSDLLPPRTLSQPFARDLHRIKCAASSAPSLSL